MSVSGISLSSQFALPTPSPVDPGTSGTADTTQPTPKHIHGHGHGHGGLVGTLIEELQQIAAAQSSSAAASTPSSTADGGTASDSSSSVAATSAPSASIGQDLHAFLHSLFEALRDQAEPAASSTTGTSTSGAGGDASSPTGVSGAGQYRSQLITGLQSLAQQLDGDASVAAPTGDSLSNLSSAFQKLVQDLGGGTAASGGSSGPTLQSFLAQLAQNLESRAQGSPASVAVNTTA
jgi:hypothetical protein